MSITEETRRADHEDIKPKFGPRAKAINTALREHGDMTAEELTDYLVSEKVIPFFDLNYVRPRLTEMNKARLVDTVDTKKSRRSGKVTAVWSAKPNCWVRVEGAV